MLHTAKQLGGPDKLGEPGGGARASGAARDADGAASVPGPELSVADWVGVRPDNMTPTNAKASEPVVTVLQQGIDSLWFSVYGTLKPEIVSHLSAAKELAQQLPGDWAPSPLPPFEGVTPQVHASGVKYYEWHCRSDDLTITLRKPGRSPMPAAIIRVSAQVLWRLGGGGRVAAELAHGYLRPLFEDGEPYRVVVKAVHVASDFQGWAPTLADLAEGGPIVKRADGLDPHLGERNALETIAAGRSSHLRVSLYNKTRQAAKKGLTWVHDLWAATGRYRASEGVWRLEYQFGREFLHERQIDTLAQLFDQLGALWAYGMGWFSYRTPNLADAAHPHRWPVAPHWVELTPWELSDAGELPRVKIVRPKFRRLVASLVGYVTSTMAIADQDDPLELLEIALRMQGERAFSDQLARKRQRYAGFTMSAA